jgi:hypothetical protein
MRHGEGDSWAHLEYHLGSRDVQHQLCHTMSAASAATGPAPATVPTAVVPTADEAAAVPVPALPTAEYLDGMAAFYKRCLAAYDARNHEGSSGRKTACDTHRIYAITELSAKCAVRGEMERERGRRMDRMSGI